MTEARPAPKARRATHRRATKETEITASLNLDGRGETRSTTGLGFLDHMMDLFGRHGRLDLEVTARGDLHVDAHHTVEDVGLVIGECIAHALGDKTGIARFGSSLVLLDEALSRVVLDCSGRPYLYWEVPFRTERVGDFPTELFEDFFRAVCDRARLTLHVELLHGRNSHHIIETVFKAFGRALHQATRPTGEPNPLSTKGTLSE